MLKNVIKTLLSNGLLAFLGLVNSFVLPVILSVDTYAQYQEYTLYLSYVNICHLGIASGMFLNYAGNKYADTEKSQYKSEVYLIYIVLAFFTVIGLIVSGVSRNIVILCVALSIFPHCIIASFQALYQAWGRFTGYAIVNALPKLLFTISVILLYFFMRELTGSMVIIIYVIITWGISIYFLIEFSAFTKGVKAAGLLSKQNLTTTINGFLITLGNYVNLLFHSIDKQFVNVLYSTTSFATYSFAMSLQNIMMLFITALANPFYLRLAQGNVDDHYMIRLKELLLMFGAYSGCAYFAVSFVVKHFITKYVASLAVVEMFFAVFPAMAVINVLYINLYKIKKMLKKYILTLVGMLCVAVILNGISVLLHGDYQGIALATMISYYVWLVYSQRDFQEVTLLKKDYIYLFGFFILYIASKLIGNDIVGFISYAIAITIWDLIIYRDTVHYYMRNEIVKKFKGNERCSGM